MRCCNEIGLRNSFFVWSEEDSASTSTFQHTVVQLELQKTETIRELLELDRKERDSYKTEVLRLRSEVKKQETELDKLTKHTTGVASERDKLRKDNNALQADLTQEVHKNSRLSDERERLRNDKKRLENELAREGETVTWLTGRIAEMIAEKGILLEEKWQAEAKHAQELDQQEERAAKLTSERDRLVNEISERGQQLALRDLHLSNLNTDLQKSKDECDHLKKDKEAFLDETKRLNDAVAELSNDASKMREELEAEKDSNSRELAKRDELQKQVEAELNRLRAEYTDHLDNCKSSLEGLNAELSRCKELLERKSRAARMIEIGYALHRKNDFPRARHLFDEAIVLDVETMFPHFHKASGYYQQANYEECVQTCKTAVAVACNTEKCVVAILYELAAEARVKQADVYPANVQQLEDKPEQMACLEDAVKFYFQSLANYFDVAVQEKHAYYANVLQQVSTKPELSQRALERGNAFFKVGDYEKALKEYDEAVKRNPGNTRLYLTRAWCHLKRRPKRCGKAIADCKSALELDPNYAAAYTKLGAAQQALGQREQAETSYKKALELDPAEREAERALNDLHSATKD